MVSTWKAYLPVYRGRVLLRARYPCGWVLCTWEILTSVGFLPMAIPTQVWVPETNIRTTTIPNGPILTKCQTIRTIMASTTKAETGAIFLNGQQAVPIHTTLIEMGHAQPPTAINSDNTTSHGILTGNMHRKVSKSFDMRFNWMRCRIKQKNIASTGRRKLKILPITSPNTSLPKITDACYIFTFNVRPQKYPAEIRLKCEGMFLWLPLRPLSNIVSPYGCVIRDVTLATKWRAPIAHHLLVRTWRTLILRHSLVQHNRALITCWSLVQHSTHYSSPYLH